MSGALSPPVGAAELTVECEPAAEGVDPARLGARLELLRREHTGIRIAVGVVEPGTIPRSEGKAVRVVDRRVRASSP